MLARNVMSVPSMCLVLMSFRIENFSEGIKVTKTTISANAGQSDLYFVFRNNEGQKENILLIDWILFDNGEVKLP